MTFTTSLKEEISKQNISLVEAQTELSAFLLCQNKIDKEIVLTLENASVARRVYKEFKMVFNISPNITVRNQKRFRVKQIYILTIKDNLELIKKSLGLNSPKITLANSEEKALFLQGAFFAIGNVSNPQTSGYHLEYICSSQKIANIINKLLVEFKLNAKTITRGYKYVVYLKSGENISDLLKLFKATSSLFFFEDIRIYRDHKNMVNRLNNCELSNQTKSLQTGLKQLENIKYLKEHDLVDILDEKTKMVIDAREKYSEVSLAELANIITLEYNYKIGKSGVNHHFIKIANMVKRHKENNENK